jgi:hypothetical protein
MGLKDFAIVIGINDYTLPKDGGLKALSGAVPDAIEVEKWLLDKENGDVPIDQCFKIISNPKTKGLAPLHFMIDEKIDEIISIVNSKFQKQADRLYFYFAGHGMGVETEESNTGLCLANWSEIRRRSALSSSDYKDLLVRLRIFKEVVFLADCCRNAVYNIRPIPSVIDTVVPGSLDTLYFVGYATQYLDQAYEINDDHTSEKRGIFTRLLLSGLRGDAADPLGNVTAESLKNYLMKNTPVVAQENGFKQVPQIWHTGYEGNSIVFKKLKHDHQINCTINFSPDLNDITELLDGTLKVVATFNTTTKSHNIDLKKGLYILKSKNSRFERTFMVSSLQNTHYVQH